MGDAPTLGKLGAEAMPTSEKGHDRCRVYGVEWSRGLQISEGFGPCLGAILWSFWFFILSNGSLAVSRTTIEG